MIHPDVVAAYRFYRHLRLWRRQRMTGHVWLRVDVAPGEAPKVQPRRWVYDTQDRLVTVTPKDDTYV